MLLTFIVMETTETFEFKRATRGKPDNIHPPNDIFRILEWLECWPGTAASLFWFCPLLSRFWLSRSICAISFPPNRKYFKSNQTSRTRLHNILKQQRYCAYIPLKENPYHGLKVLRQCSTLIRRNIVEQNSRNLVLLSLFSPGLNWMKRKTW